MEISETRVGDVAVLTVTGEIDADNGYPLFLAALNAVEAGSSEVVFELSGVTFIDSVGLGMIVRSRDELAELHGAALVLERPSRRVQQLLDVTALREHFTIRD